MAEQPATTQVISAADLMALETQGKRYEVWDEHLREKEMATIEHGEIEALLIVLLGSYVLANKLGKVYGSDVTYVLAGTKQRLIAGLMPDVSFVSTARLEGIDRRDFFYIPPDLAIEVISPTEKPADITTKIQTYLNFGTAQVWVVYPEEKRITVYAANGDHRDYGSTETLEGGALLAGLVLPLSQIFGGEE